MTTAVELQAKGLFTHPNRLLLPPGAQLLAENCVYTREGIVSRRRGMNRYGDILITGAKELFRFAGRIIVLDGDLLRFDSDGAGTWTSWTGTFTQPDSSIRMRFLETEDSFLFTTDAGVFINDALTNLTPVRSGMPRGLDLQLSTTGTGAGFFLPDNQVGYRITWRRKDANLRITQGSPSFQERLTNSFTTDLAWTSAAAVVTVTHTAHPFSNGDTITIKDATDPNIPDGDFVISNVLVNSYDFTVSVAPTTSPGTLSDGKAFDVVLTFTVPDDVVAGNEFEIFRTPLSADDALIPGAEHRLIITRELTSAEKTAGTVTLTDDNLEDFFTANLYTNPSQETEDLANDRPPLARIIVQFESHVFYFRTTYPHRLTLHQLDVAVLNNGDTITIDDGTTTETYTYAAVENGPAGDFQLFTSFATAVQNIEATIKSLQKIINRNSTAWTAQYTSGVDGAPGIITLEERGIGGDAFSVIADSTATGDTWEPALPTAGTTVESENDERKNGYVRSKSSQPEHVPELSGSRLGRGSLEILGAEFVTDALWVYKKDGIYLISGQSDLLGGALFREDDIDPTVTLSAVDSLITLNNAVAGFANQGFFLQAAATPQMIDRPQIQDTLRRIAALSAFDKAFAVNYETENSLLFFTPENSADTENAIAHVWNYTTLAWSTWRKPIQSGIVLDSDDKLYLGHNDDMFVLQERKSLDNVGTDYSDEDIDITIDSTSTTTDPDDPDQVVVTELTLTYTYTTPLAAGFIVEQGASRTYIEAVVDNGGNSFTCRLRRLVTGFTTGAANVQLPIDMLVEWIVTGDNPNAGKQFAHCSIYAEQAGGTHLLGFHSDYQKTREFINPIRIPKGTGWGSIPWGSSPWGSSAPGDSPTISTPIPTNHQHGRTQTVRYENHYARQPVNLLMMACLIDQYDERSQREPR